MLYNPPTGGAANDPYVGKNVAAGTQGSKVPPGAVEYPQRELVALIVASGQTPTNTDQQQALRSVRSGVLEYYTDSGAANAPAISPSPAHTALVDGLHVRVRMKAPPDRSDKPCDQRAWRAGAAYRRCRVDRRRMGCKRHRRSRLQRRSKRIPDRWPYEERRRPDRLRRHRPGRPRQRWLEQLPSLADPEPRRRQSRRPRRHGYSRVGPLRRRRHGRPFSSLPHSRKYILSNIVATNTFQQVAGQSDPLRRRHEWPRHETPARRRRRSKTLSAALAFGTGAYNFTSGTLTINLAAGTYAAPATIPVGSGTINIVGNTSNPGAYVISGQGTAGGSVLIASSKVNLTGLTVQNTGSIAGTVTAGTGGAILLTNVSLVTTASGNAFAHIAGNGGAITLGGGVTISGSMGAAFTAVGGGQITIFGSVAFLECADLLDRYGLRLHSSARSSSRAALSAAAFSGAVTGVRYSVNQNSIVSILNGGGLTAFPGTAAGTTATGGIYG